VPLFDLKFLNEIMAGGAGTSNRRHWPGEASLQHRYLHVLQFALVNLVATGLVAAAYLQHWLDGLYAQNTRALSALIFAVFLYGVVVCGAKIWRTSGDLNDIAAPAPGLRAAEYLRIVGECAGESRSLRINMLRLELTHRITGVRHIANALVFLGLIGTVIGFIIALSGVDPASTAEVDKVAPMVSTLIKGMSIALYTTLLGAVLNVWLMIDYRILTNGTVRLIAAIITRASAP